MSSQINEQLLLLKISINHFKTESVFFHWLKWSFDISFSLILPIITLLTLPSSFFTGFINRQDDGFCRKPGLCSFSVINKSNRSYYTLDAVKIFLNYVALFCLCDVVMLVFTHFIDTIGFVSDDKRLFYFWNVVFKLPLKCIFYRSKFDVWYV